MPQVTRTHPAPTMPTGTEVASYATYLEAQQGVDFLSENGFDVSAITIVGSDLHLVERVMGRLTIARAALSGASNGGLWGALFGMLMSAGAGGAATGGWVFGGLLGGALLGMGLSALAYTARGGRRDFVSSSQVVASRYAVLASSDIDTAYRLLQRTPGNQSRARAARERTEDSGPTEYGSRPDEEPRFGVRLSGARRADGAPDRGAQGAPASTETSAAGAAPTGRACAGAAAEGPASVPVVASSEEAVVTGEEAPASASVEGTAPVSASSGEGTPAPGTTGEKALTATDGAVAAPVPADEAAPAGGEARTGAVDATTGEGDGGAPGHGGPTGGSNR